MSKIHEVLPKIMGEVGAIGMDRKNVQQGYAFRGIDDVYNAAQPAFVKHGVFIVPRVKSFSFSERESKQGGILRFCVCELEANFTADDGSSIQTVTIGEALDSGDKAAGKAQSYALKVAVLQTLCIPTEGDNDTENHSHEPKHGGSAANTTPPARTAPTPRPAAPADTVSEAEIRLLYARAKAAGADAASLPEVLATEFPYLKDASGAVHLLALKREHYLMAQTICGTLKPAAAAPDAPAAAPAEGFREFWPEQEITPQTTIVVASIEAVNEPTKGKSGKFGPFKIDAKADGQVFTVDTFDTTLADICKASGDALREVAFEETVNGRYTNRKLVGVR